MVELVERKREEKIMTIWVVIQEDMGMGISLVSAHLDKEEAENVVRESHRYELQEVDLLTTKKITVE
jgi:hypothetical protein